MAFKKPNSNTNLYSNSLRTKWETKIEKIDSLLSCTNSLIEHRNQNIAYDRTTHNCSDRLWIESALEHKLAQLKTIHLSDHDLQNNCSTGNPADKTILKYKSLIEKCSNATEIEKIARDLRVNFKPPIMPVNKWLNLDKIVQDKIMIQRAEDHQQPKSLEELRELRGAKVIQAKKQKTHTISINFNNNETINFECAESEDIISAASRNNYNLISKCRTGQCATCRSECTKGDYIIGDGINIYSLPPEDQEKGIILTCETYPTSDMQIEMNYSKDLVESSTDSEKTNLMARVSMIDQIDSLNIFIVLDHLDPLTEKPKKLRYLPGQFISINAPGTNDWFYLHLSEVPSPAGKLSGYVNKVTNRNFFHNISENFYRGQNLSIKGPHGKFKLKLNSSPELFFFADDSGFSAILAMLRRIRTEKKIISVIISVSKTMKLHWEKILVEFKGSPQINFKFLGEELFLADPDKTIHEFIELKMKKRDNQIDLYVCCTDRIADQVSENKSKHTKRVRNLEIEVAPPYGV